MPPCAGGSPHLPLPSLSYQARPGGAAHAGRVFHDREDFYTAQEQKVFAIMDGILGEPLVAARAGPVVCTGPAGSRPA